MENKILIARKIKVRIIIFSGLSKYDVAVFFSLYYIALKTSKFIPPYLSIYYFITILILGIYLYLNNTKVLGQKNYEIIIEFIKYFIRKLNKKRKYLFVDDYKYVNEEKFEVIEEIYDFQ